LLLPWRQIARLPSIPEPEVCLCIIESTGALRLIADETDKWGKVIRAANIKPE
jgi:hypothetical protein